MLLTLWLPIALYSAVTSITPGPNNLMLLSSGVRFGVRRSVPHMLGISIGGSFMVAMVGLGLMQVFHAWPLLQELLKWAGMAYLLWLAWQLARAPAPQESGSPGGTAASARPLGFWGAVAFQWINPKLWVMALGLFGTYLPAHSSMADVVTASVVFGIVNLPCISSWAVAGQGLRHWLQNPVALRLFNGGMAVALLASMLPVML